ncbi:MAG TPA: lytic transglycosylase F [Burkholderiales bacterium]|nr:lytic transglycosylase F [Burkholderiales bacterium]
MIRVLLPLLVGLALVVQPATAQSPQPAKPKPQRAGLPHDLITRQWTGDLDGMVERRLIRVLTVYSKTFFFVDKGTQRGVVHDIGRALEHELNRKLKAKRQRVSVAFIPVSRDELLPALVAGRGDIAAANLTITPERLKTVDFGDPWLKGVDEIVVTGPHSPPIATLDDLQGKEVFARKSSSYYENLVKLNATFKQQGKAAVKLTPAPEALEDEDLLEMLNAGLIKVVVVDSHKAQFWKQVFPELTLHPEVAVDTGGQIAWAIRKDSPTLKHEVNEFVKKHGKGSAFGNEIFHRYLKSTRYVKNATADAEVKKFKATIELFRKYGDKYGLDWMLMAAQGYQESRLDQNAKSAVGAIGVMQVMPATGKELNVGDITQVDPNIHAGVKYIRFMIDQYYKNEPMDDLNKGLFAFASYNAGPGRIAGLRKEAAKRGLNQNVWFNNVERVAAEKIGRETVTYVSNIYKYYVAYALVQGEYLERMEARKQFMPQK